MMNELIKSEYTRYKGWGFLATAVVLGMYGFITRFKPFLQPNDMQSAFIYLSLIGGSLLFGILQVVMHKRASHWTYLIHRPLSTTRIYLALTLAGLAIISLVVIVPLLTMVGGIDTFSAVVVDVRHYLYILHIFLASILAYLIGQLIILNASKGIVVLILLFAPALAVTHTSNIALFFPLIVMIAGVFYLNIKSFKPDLNQYLRNPLSIFLLAVPMSFAFAIILLISTTLFYHVPKYIAGTHPDDNPQIGSMEYMFQLNIKERPAYALETNQHKRIKSLVAQTQLVEPEHLDVDVWTFPRRGQLPNKDRSYSYAFIDDATHTTWQFSHTSMLLEGRSNNSRGPIGAIGKQGFIENTALASANDKFKKVPFLLNKQFVMTADTIYQLNLAELTLDIKHQLVGDESYVGRPQFKKQGVVVVTSKRTLIFDTQDFINSYDTVEPDYIVLHPSALEDMRYVVGYPVAGGYMMLYFSNRQHGFDKPGAHVILAQIGGEALPIGSRSFDLYAHPAWIRHFRFIISPVIYSAQSMLLHALEPQDLAFASYERLSNREYPQSIYLVSFILHVLSGLTVFALTRHHRHGKSQRIIWVLLGTLIGLPALFSFILLNPWHVTRRLFAVRSPTDANPMLAH
jgi:hypothetical protein